MLDKTLALLADIPRGTHVAEAAACYDEAEIVALGALLSRLVYAPSTLRRRLQRLGVTLTRADDYSEIPTVDDIERSFARPSLLQLDAIFADAEFLRAELRALATVSHEFDPPLAADGPGAFAWINPAFSYSDAMALYCMIRTRRPACVVEVGGGWSTLVARMALARNGAGRIVCVEPSPPSFLRACADVELIEARVQDLGTDIFNDRLADGDMLFVDSSHTVRHDSDVLHIYLRILPGLRRRTLVHAHDIYLPHTLPREWLRDLQVTWTEQYLLYAYFLGNPRVRALFGSRYHRDANPALLEAFMHGRCAPGGGSLWFEQAAAG